MEGNSTAPAEAPNNAPEKLHKMSAARYLSTRLSTLKPPMHPVPNPIRLLGMLNTQQWLFFLLGFLGWTVRYLARLPSMLHITDHAVVGCL